METVNELNIIQDHINKYFVFATPAPPPVHIFLNPAFIVVCLFSSIISFSRLFLDPSDQDLDREHNQLFLQLERMRNSDAAEGEDHVAPPRLPWKRWIPSWKENYERLCRGEADSTSVCCQL